MKSGNAAAALLSAPAGTQRAGGAGAEAPDAPNGTSIATKRAPPDITADLLR